MFFIILLAIVGAPAAYFGSKKWQEYQERKRASGSSKQKKLRTIDDRERLPYRYADDLIFIHGDSVWTGLKLAGTTDEYLTTDEKADAAAVVAHTYNTLLAVFNGESVHCHEQVRYRPSSAVEWERAYLKSLWHPTRLFKQLVEQVSSLLTESTPERQRFLMVRLGEFKGDAVPDPLSMIATKVTAVADEHFSSADLQPFRDLAVRVHLQLAAFRATPCTRGDLIWLIRKTLSGHRFPEEQPILSSKPLRNSFFDMAVNFRGRNGEDYVEIIDTDPETGEQRSTYTTTLVVANAAAVSEFNPATAWGPILAQLPRPVELSWRYELLTASEFKARAIKVTDNVKDEARDRAKGNAVEDPAFDQKYEQSEMLFHEVSTQPQPAMIGRLRLVLSAPSPRELAAAEKDVRTVMGDIEMVRVPRAQSMLLKEQLPGDYQGKVFGGLVAASGGGVQIGERVTDVWAPAVARLDSDDQVGDSFDAVRARTRGWRGFPIGYTYSNGSPVHFGLHVQVARDRGAGIAIIGASGGGKSTLALLLYFWESESGTQCMVLDPKNDFEKFTLYIAFGQQVMDPAFAAEAEAGILGTDESQFRPVNPEFWADTTIISLARGTAGQMDAWSLCDTYADADELARGQIEVLFDDPQDRKVVEHGLVAMKEAYEAQQVGSAQGQDQVVPSMGTVVQYLAAKRAGFEKMAADPNNSNAFDATKELERYDRVINRFKRARETRYAKLLVGNGTQIDMGDMTRRRVIFTLHGFVPPAKPDQPESWSESERNAAAAMFTALTLVQNLFDDTPRRNPVTGVYATPPRALFVDEGYMIARQPTGQGILSRGLRQGRSLNLVIVFISQQPRDVQELEKQAKDAGEADTNQFGTVFVFRQKSPGEAAKALELLRDTSGGNSTETAELARKLLEVGKSGGLLRGGRCVMRDVDNRVATVSVDQMFAELARATETNPAERPIAQSQPISSDGRMWQIDPSTMFEVRTGILEAHGQAMAGVDDIEHDPEWQQFIADNERELERANLAAEREIEDLYSNPQEGFR
ncbi:ATP-binding protein [Prescottella equi]